MHFCTKQDLLGRYNLLIYELLCQCLRIFTVPQMTTKLNVLTES